MPHTDENDDLVGDYQLWLKNAECDVSEEKQGQYIEDHPEWWEKF